MHRTRGTKGTGVGHTEHGNGDDGIEDGRKTLDTRQLNGEHKGGGLGVGTGRAQQIRVVGRQDQADDEEGDDIETGDTPEHLFGGCGKRLAGVGGLGCGETDELGATESEGGGHEDGTEAFESVLERPRVVPVMSSDVAAVRSIEIMGRFDTSAVDDDAEDDEPDDSENLDHSQNEFDFTISANAEDLNDTEEEEEDGDPDADVDVAPPEVDCQTGRGDFERQDREPADCIIPPHGKTPANDYHPVFLQQQRSKLRSLPGFIDEPAAVSEESAVDGVEDREFSQSLHGK